MGNLFYYEIYSPLLLSVASSLPRLITKPSQITSVNSSQTWSPCTETTGTNTRRADNSWLTATSMSPRTGSVPENASTPGSAEVPDSVRVKDGATVMIPAKRSTSEQIA